MDEEAKSLEGLQVNWLKIKIQTTDFFFPPGSYMPVAGDNVKVVESFALIQGSHASWKVLDFVCEFSRPWKVLENGFGPGKTWKF